MIFSVVTSGGIVQAASSRASRVPRAAAPVASRASANAAPRCPSPRIHRGKR
jgi:hypothetical protein